MEKKITRQQMIAAVRANVDWRAQAAGTGAGTRGHKKMADWGNDRRLRLARALLHRLERGENPTTREVVGYFGKGARFSA